MSGMRLGVAHLGRLKAKRPAEPEVRTLSKLFHIILAPALRGRDSDKNFEQHADMEDPDSAFLSQIQARPRLVGFVAAEHDAMDSILN
jgi:hypothetical protein